MDRYNGYVSNYDYQGRGMASQTRVLQGPGGCCPSTSNQYKQMIMPPPQRNPCEYQPANRYSNGYDNGNGKPVVYEQPRPTSRDVKKMVFSHDGREWTTGVCGCFEHCASCKLTCYIPCPFFLSLPHVSRSKRQRLPPFFFVFFYLSSPMCL